MAAVGYDTEAAQRPLLASSGNDVRGVIDGVREIEDGKHNESYSVKAAILPFFFPALGGLLYGYDIGATSGATISLQSVALSGTTWHDLSSVEIGLQAMHAAPMYIAETAPSQIRGVLISLKEFFIVLGMLLGYISSSIFVDLFAGWRYMYASSGFASVIMVAGMWWLPPSPRWLLLCALQGKRSMNDVREYATCCYCKIRGRPVDSSASEQINVILVELSYSGQESQGSFREVFEGKSLKALTIGGGLVFFQQVTGQPSVLYYAATILQSAGFSAASDATRVSILLGLLKLIMTGVAVLVVDKLGRRPLLLGGVSGIALSLFLLATYFTLLKGAALVAVIALLLYVGCYQLSFGPIGWLMISEIFPLRLRGRGLSIAVFINFATNALVTFAFSPLEMLVGTGALFAAFGVIAILSLAFIFFIVPETKGLTLEEIEAKIL